MLIRLYVLAVTWTLVWGRYLLAVDEWTMARVTLGLGLTILFAAHWGLTLHAHFSRTDT